MGPGRGPGGMPEGTHGGAVTSSWALAEGQARPASRGAQFLGVEESTLAPALPVLAPPPLGAQALDALPLSRAQSGGFL